MISQAQMYALAVVWVGGWGFMFFAYPELARVYRPQRANTSLSRYWCGRGLCRVV
jgi:hypothetical protein